MQPAAPGDVPVEAGPERGGGARAGAAGCGPVPIGEDRLRELLATDAVLSEIEKAAWLGLQLEVQESRSLPALLGGKPDAATLELLKRHKSAAKKFSAELTAAARRAVKQLDAGVKRVAAQTKRARRSVEAVTAR